MSTKQVPKARPAVPAQKAPVRAAPAQKPVQKPAQSSGAQAPARAPVPNENKIAIKKLEAEVTKLKNEIAGLTKKHDTETARLRREVADLSQRHTTDMTNLTDWVQGQFAAKAEEIQELEADQRDLNVRLQGVFSEQALLSQRIDMEKQNADGRFELLTMRLQTLGSADSDIYQRIDELVGRAEFERRLVDVAKENEEAHAQLLQDYEDEGNRVGNEMEVMARRNEEMQTRIMQLEKDMKLFT